ncbi:aldo/keto reductase [Microbacterium sp. EYE_5]|uniref:aldo/keto reductase n=1 Tax=unclassified Microbacterium TaxID=2609290 RepID=UPI0020050704|nr:MULTISPECIES: aldo/keto reductase [unclassified Microbacterium]MCK6080413.1 aldo/keto reductase [Microbacterium sp. EYE_382]MCK6085684.1 aldo/keto reductase [Microbacterium sp. EYE_384]MCK6124818.1 aldo/keto reductase [Microbacterium sp. EYE_80]MCK6127727.1 aldo/keto reductase [Microbacterium sp. EYE_79]MCK6141368.1 aldo/keto reductase [Microbacterium sp. EYE_39]
MQQRRLGRTGRSVSVIGLGTWQLGADWGDVSEEEAIAVLSESLDAGVTLFDTADVYGDGRSETLIGRFLAGRPGHGVTVATKMGRRLPQEPENYTPENFRAWTDRSRRNLGVETLDLVQLHCPPSAVIDADATYDALDALVGDGTIAAYGVSVETTDQALAAIARPNVAGVQIIFNPFRLKPLDEVLPAAAAADVAIFARVPLASGLLSGKYSRDTSFAANDHRAYNRNGEAFDRGETFSGVDYETGLVAVEELSAALPEGVSLPAASLAWIASRPGVTSVIPGARNTRQARANAAAADLLDGADLSSFEAAVADVYDRRLRADIHPQW